MSRNNLISVFDAQLNKCSYNCGRIVFEKNRNEGNSKIGKKFQEIT